MHEKNKYRHIPWNRYNLEKYRDINFWSNRPALSRRENYYLDSRQNIYKLLNQEVKIIILIPDKTSVQTIKLLSWFQTKHLYKLLNYYLDSRQNIYKLLNYLVFRQNIYKY